MRKIIQALTASLLMAVAASSAKAETVYYQPTPYPWGSTNGLHVVEGWIFSEPGQGFSQGEYLQIGGSTYDYDSFIKFDLTGLPAVVDQAYMWILPYDRADGSTTTPFAVCPVTSSWDASTISWTNQPTYGSCYGWYAAPTAGTWTGFWVQYPGGPTWYNDWQSGSLSKSGLMLMPQNTSNNFDNFFSTGYNNYPSDPYADARRPELQLTFTPPVTVPNFKMPLPRNVSWLVTTEVGGYDCLGNYDSAHSGTNYFSVDFGWGNHDSSGSQVYGNPNSGAMIPILAAADGVVEAVINSTSDSNYPNDGYMVAISHDPSHSLSTGFSTRYLHLKTRRWSRLGIRSPKDKPLDIWAAQALVAGRTCTSASDITTAAPRLPT